MAVIPLTQERPTQAYLPTLADRFSFGPWTVGNVGRGPFGDHTLGTNGVSLHDDDLVPFGTSSAERDGIVRRFRGALEASRCAPQERYRNEYLDQLVVELLLGIANGGVVTRSA